MPIDSKKMNAFAGPSPDTDEVYDEEAEEGTEQFRELLPTLEEGAGELEVLSQTLGLNPQEVLAQTPEDFDEELLASYEEEAADLDDDLQEVLGGLVGASVGKCRQLAAHLQDEGLIEDENMVAAVLYMAAISAGAGDEELADEGDDEEELADDDAGEILELDESGEEI